MSENRLAKRLWLVENFDFILEEMVYYRRHKEAFSLPRVEVWKWDTKRGEHRVD